MSTIARSRIPGIDRILGSTCRCGNNASYSTKPEYWSSPSNVTGFIENIGVLPNTLRPAGESSVVRGYSCSGAMRIFGAFSGTDMFGSGTKSLITSRIIMYFGVGSPEKCRDIVNNLNMCLFRIS